MKKKYLFVIWRGYVFSIFSREHPLFPFFFSSFYLFSLSHISCLSFVISHLSSLISNFSFLIYKIVLKMKSYEILMQNIRLLQKEVLLLHLI